MNQTRLPVAILLICILVGCSDANKYVSEHSNDTSIHTQQTSEFTIDDAISIFTEDNEFTNYEITDLILVKDEQFPMLKAVISYFDKKENNRCNLAFIYGDVSYKICFAVNEVDGVRTFDIAEDSHLTYVGNGTVTKTIRKIDTSEIIDYKISFSQNYRIPNNSF